MQSADQLIYFTLCSKLKEIQATRKEEEKMGNTSPGEIRIDTDVLVLGAGAAGCLAAYGAKEQGIQNVTLVDKGALVSCGCTGAGQDHFGAHLNTGPDWDTDEAATTFTADQDGVWGTSERRPYESRSHGQDHGSVGCGVLQAPDGTIIGKRLWGNQDLGGS
jgi:hypothetical protein